MTVSHPEQRARSAILWIIGAWILAFGISLTAFAVGLLGLGGCRMFEVGERVVCVDDKFFDGAHTGLKNGSTYTVERIWLDTRLYYGPSGLGTGLWLVDLIGVVHPDLDRCGYGGWHVNRFRPLRKLDTSESLKALKQLAIDCPPLVEVK